MRARRWLAVIGRAASPSEKCARQHYPAGPRQSEVPTRAECGAIRHSAEHVWQRRTNNWRRVTSPERAAKRLKKRNKPLRRPPSVHSGPLQAKEKKCRADYNGGATPSKSTSCFADSGSRRVAACGCGMVVLGRRYDGVLSWNRRYSACASVLG
jgi:hypothetical protein